MPSKSESGLYSLASLPQPAHAHIKTFPSLSLSLSLSPPPPTTTTRRYPNAEVVWAQEEPKNMGSWTFVQERIMTGTEAILGKEVRPQYVGRKTMASPAEGYAKEHEREQGRIVSEAMTTAE